MNEDKPNYKLRGMIYLVMLIALAVFINIIFSKPVEDESVKVEEVKSVPKVEVPAPKVLLRDIILKGKPRLGEGVAKVEEYYHGLSEVVTTNQYKFDYPTAGLIFHHDGGVIDEIVGYPVNIGLRLNLNECIVLIKSFTLIEPEISEGNAIIMEGEGKPKVYAWAASAGGQPISIIALENGGLITSFALFIKSGKTYYVPFMTSAEGYTVTRNPY